MVRKIGIIMQAHMSSTRLPGKVLKFLKDKAVIGHDIERLKKVKNIDSIIVATSDKSVDDILVNECKKYNINIFRGNDDNVLSRFYYAAKKYELTDIIRICSDNPLLDWEIINKELDLYLTNKYDIVTSSKNIPLGLGGEIFSFKLLEEAYQNANKNYQFEHVTPYIYEHSLNIGYFDIDKDLSKYRFTLDEQSDWILIETIYNELYNGKHDFLLKDIVTFMNNNSSLYKINCNVKQKKVK